MRILYLDLDTLRPDHLGCYGYQRNTSPNIDWIASEGVRFQNYHTPDAPCLPSRSSLMSGTFGIHHGAINHGGVRADMRLQGKNRSFVTDLGGGQSIPSFLRKNGIPSTYIGGFGDRHSIFTFYAGFNEIVDTCKKGLESAEEVTPAALDWIKRNAKNENWYLQVNYWDAHTPYRAPEEFGNPFANEPIPEWMTSEVVDFQKENTVGLHGIGEVNMYNDNENPKFPRQPGKVQNIDDARKIFDGYDCGIRYMDGHIGQLLEALKEEGVLDDLVIIVSSDHGENLGEMGLWAEHGSADQITTRIPMIVRWPNGGLKGHVDNALHYNIDLAPTLADMLNAEKHVKWEGKSYAKAITNGEEDGQEYLIVSQCCHGCQRGVRFGDWIYIRTYHDFFHLFPKEMLFNLKEDPHEQNNLAEARQDICMLALKKLTDWHDEMMLTQPEGYDNDPMWEIIHEGGPFHARGHLKNYIERLKNTGRERYVEELTKRHPKEFQK